LLPDSTPETEKKMNDYLASQLITQRQADVLADATHRALVKEARAARKASAASAARPVRARLRLILRFATA
jgi:type IV secretory pathway VirD2 relaxase